MSINDEGRNDLLARMRVSGYSKTEREAVLFLTMMASYRSESESVEKEMYVSSSSSTSESSNRAGSEQSCSSDGRPTDGATALSPRAPSPDSAGAHAAPSSPLYRSSSEAPSPSDSSRHYESDDSSDSYASCRRPIKGLSQALSGLRVFSSQPRGRATSRIETRHSKPVPRARRAARPRRPSLEPPSKKGSSKKNKENKEESYGRTTRDLLLHHFTRRTLATHSLSGKRSPAFQHKPPKPRLDPGIIDAIVREVCEKHNVLPSVVRMAITTKCADETKMMLMRLKQRNGSRHGIKA